MLNRDTALVAKHFYNKVLALLKEIILDDLLEKINYHAICIEIQERSSPYVYSSIWIFNAPSIRNETNYKDFVEKRVNSQLPDQLHDQELF